MTLTLYLKQRGQGLWWHTISQHYIITIAATWGFSIKIFSSNDDINKTIKIKT